MPVSFTPDNIPRFEDKFLSYLNENMQRLKNALAKVAVETISSTPPTGPYEGQEYTDTATNIKYVWDGTNWVAAYHYGAWPVLTPGIIQSVSVPYTGANIRYIKEGRTIHYKGQCSLTGSGTANNPIRVGLPASAAVAGYQCIGAGYLYYAALNVNIPLIALQATTATMCFITAESTSNGELGLTGAGPAGGNTTLNSGSFLTWNVSYESAT